MVGGFHQTLPPSEKMSAPPEDVRDLARALGDKVRGPICTGHCTGVAAFDTMRPVLGEPLHALHTGDRIKL